MSFIFGLPSRPWTFVIYIYIYIYILLGLFCIHFRLSEKYNLLKSDGDKGSVKFVNVFKFLVIFVC